MGGKRKSEDKEERIRKKIKKLEEKLWNTRKRKRIIVESSDSSDELQDANVTPNLTYEEDEEEPQAGPSTTQLRSICVNTANTSNPLPWTPSQSICESPAAEVTETVPAQQQVEELPAKPSMSENIDMTLDSEILSLLGDAPKTDSVLGKPIHKDIASRWQEILQKGLQKEVKDKILSEYTIPSNCDFLVPPVLNPEAKAALTEIQLRRDFSLMLKQKQSGVALSALAQVTELIIKRETSTEKLLKPISDACRLICDTHYSETKIRRNFIISVVNSDIKETLLESVRDKYLFGENLADKLKNAKTIQQSGQNLVTKKSTVIFNRNPNNIKPNNFRLNFKALHQRKSATNQDVGRYRSPATQSTSTTGQRQPRRSFNRQPRAERSPPPPPPQPTRRAYRK